MIHAAGRFAADGNTTVALIKKTIRNPKYCWQACR
jgi:hypothetical protein